MDGFAWASSHTWTVGRHPSFMAHALMRMRTLLASKWPDAGQSPILRKANDMDAPATIKISRHALEVIIELLIELVDIADRVAAIEAEKAAQDVEV